MAKIERRSAVVWGVGILLSIGLLAGCALLGMRTTNGGRAEQAGDVDVDVDPVRIGAIAAWEAGERHPTDIEWVLTTRADAAKVAPGSVGAPADADLPVHVIQMDGAFTPPGDRPAGSAGWASTGSVLVVTIDATTGEVLEAGCAAERIDLRSLGTVHAEPDGA